MLRTLSNFAHENRICCLFPSHSLQSIDKEHFFLFFSFCRCCCCYFFIESINFPNILFSSSELLYRKHKSNGNAILPLLRFNHSCSLSSFRKEKRMSSDDFSKQNRLNSKDPIFYPLVVGIYNAFSAPFTTRIRNSISSLCLIRPLFWSN